MEVLPGNADVWSVIEICAGQWRTAVQAVAGQGFVEVRTSYLGFDLPAALAAARSLGIVAGPAFLRNLRTFEAEVVSILADGAKRCTPAKRKACAFQYGSYLDWTCEHCEENPARRRQPG